MHRENDKIQITQVDRIQHAYSELETQELSSGTEPCSFHAESYSFQLSSVNHSSGGNFFKLILTFLTLRSINSRFYEQIYNFFLKGRAYLKETYCAFQAKLMKSIPYEEDPFRTKKWHLSQPVQEPHVNVFTPMCSVLFCLFNPSQSSVEHSSL